MTTESEKTKEARAKIVRHIVAQLRSRCSGRDETESVLDDLRKMSIPRALAEELLGNPNRRANLKRVAFPGEGADHAAIDAAIVAGNTLVSLDALAGKTFFDFEGRQVETHRAARFGRELYEGEKRNDQDSVFCFASHVRRQKVFERLIKRRP